MMNDFTPLTQSLLHSQVKVDPIVRDCPSEGFNFPVFKQLNKQARVYLSQRFTPTPSVLYQLFAVANLKGWFAAGQASPLGFNLIFSPLEDLRSAFAVAKGDAEDLFSPKRTLPIASGVNIIAFACGDTRLLVGLENGFLAVYDTATLFAPGVGEVAPLKMTQVQSSPLRQIVPNPGTDPNLSDLLAIIGDGKVGLLNMQLERQGGWAASDLMTQPISVAWSPKGKHIALGLQTGDILTFSLANKSTPNKHIPPTADAILISLTWLGPGHIFRTSYAAQDSSPAKQHIIALDAKSSTATYVAPDHPFPAYDRTQQNSYVLSFPKWDEDSPSGEGGKCLTVVGDFSSVDLEILGNVGNRWFRQLQDNPLSLPLDALMDDTILLSLVADLTDTATGAPILYAYLNDGSLQGWHVEHNKRYLGFLTQGPSSSATIPLQTQEPKDTDMASDSAAPTPPPVAPTAFSQPSFSQPFGGQPSTTFGKTGFGQIQGKSAFGQPSFGQPAFGQPSLGSFGQSSQASSSNVPSAFGSAKPATGFGAFAGSGSAPFGSGTFGSGSSTFGGFGSTSTGHAFGQVSFSNIPAGTITTTSGSLSANISPTITQEASMSDDTPGFGGLSLGSTATTDPKAINSMFGTFGSTSTSSRTESIGDFGGGSLVKPATGFGAFSGFKTSGAFDPSNKPASIVNAFSSSVTQMQPTSSGFGQTGFGPPSTKPAFGQATFGKTSFGTPQTMTTTTTAGGFGAFAGSPTSFASATQASQQSTGFNELDSKSVTSGGFSPFASAAPTPLRPTSEVSPAESKQASGGFGAFASSSSTPFSSALAPKPINETQSSSGGGSASFASATPAVGSTKLSTTTPARTSVLGTPLGGNGTSSTTSPFAAARKDDSTTTPKETPVKPAMSPPSSPEPSSAAPSTSTLAVGGAFANIQTTPSAFKPAAGFGAFGNTTPKDSPFFRKPEQTTSAFTPFTPPSTSIPTKTAGFTITTPTFGSPSVLGAPKSAFSPTTPTTPTSVKSSATPSTSSAFSAFSGSSNPLGALAGQRKSFSDLLKTGGEENKDPEKPSAPSTPTKTERTKPQESEEKQQQSRTSVFATPKADKKKAIDVPGITEDEDEEARKSVDKGKGKARQIYAEPDDAREESYSNTSASSTSSSFVEVDITRKDEEESDRDADHQDDRSDFLTDEEELSEGQGGSEEEEQESLLEEGEVEEQEEPQSPTPSPIANPLSSSRSSSATPQPDPPQIEVSDGGKSSPKVTPSREATVTPPGTPPKVVSPVPPPVIASSSFGIGLGRPSTRPTRRSPLANAVVLDEAADEETQEPASKLASKPAEVPSLTNERPKTPPLPSTAPKGAGSLLTPPSITSTTLGRQSPPPDTFTKKPATPAPASSFGLGQRPATTPPTNLFEKPPDDLASNLARVPARAATAPAATAPATSPGPQLGLFGLPTPTMPGSAITNVFGMPSFTLGKTAPPQAAPTASTPGIFGASGALPTKRAAPLTGHVPSQVPAGKTAFGNLSTQPTTPAATTPVDKAAPASVAKTQEEILEEGMQKECVNLVKSVEKNMQELAIAAANARHTFASLYVSLGGSRNKTDLGKPAKWGLADVKRFGEVLLQYQSDLELLDANKEKERQSLSEIKSNILKAGTRREEIARFNKAKDDNEFAKMLKARTLGPEHSETQTQLRKSIRTIRDRVQKLEQRLQGDKKRLAETQSCKPRIKAPSLDTINRTFRNIEIAIEQQTDDINRLSTRISEISLADAAAASSLGEFPLLRRDSRLPDLPGPRRPLNVTPNVAVTTAAALNAERSAHRLKKALLAVRKEPLLNTKAAAAPSAPSAFNTPSKPGADADLAGKVKGFEGLKGPLFTNPAPKAPELDVEDWTLPEDHFDPTGSHGSLGGSAGGRRDKPKRSHRGTTLARKSPAPETSTSPDASGVTTTTSPPKTAPVSFDWGPLPTFASPSPPKILPTPFTPISPPSAGNASGSAPEPLEGPKNVPKGFVSFSSVSTMPSVPEPLEAPKNVPKGFMSFSTISPPAAAPSSSASPKGFFNVTSPSPVPTNLPPGFSFFNTQK